MSENNELYTVEQVARRLDLHAKTVRRYINEGKLQAHRVGGQWRISNRHLAEFTGEELNSTPQSSGEKDTTKESKNRRIEVSAIIDIHVNGSEEAIRIANSLTAAMNSRGHTDEPARCDHLYYETEKRARFILWGSPGFVSTMLDLLSVIA